MEWNGRAMHNVLNKSTSITRTFGVCCLVMQIMLLYWLDGNTFASIPTNNCSSEAICEMRGCVVRGSDRRTVSSHASPTPFLHPGATTAGMTA